MSEANMTVDDSRPQTIATPTDPGVRHRVRNLFVVGGSMTVDGGEGGVVNGLFPVIQASLSLGMSALGILTAAGRLVNMIAGPFWVWLARKTSRKFVLALATGFWGAWAFGAALSQNFTQLLIFYTIAAAGFAASHAIIPEVIGDSFEDRKRGRVSGLLYGGTAALGSLLAPLIGQLANVEDGWRYGFAIFGGLNIVFGLLIVIFYRDPASGSAERQLADLSAEQRSKTSKVTWSSVVSLMKIRSFTVLLLSRMLSSHMLFGAFGVVLLVQDFGLTTALAASVMAPFGIGYLAGTFIGGFLSDGLNKLSPNYGRVGLLQGAQFLFALVAAITLFGGFSGLAPFLLMFGLLGVAQGLNPGVNRPLVMAIVPPELRGAAFAIFVSIVESLGFAIYSLVGGFLAESIGLTAVMFWLVVVVMTINGVVLTALYPIYHRDRDAMTAELEQRRRQVVR
ncbi:MFS transporter [Microbacterium sp. YY-01]|uniref:MFS transporter n=1 Tax=Microbacterium sp. YY-01 TaxID=3421634 RepID=UPI003D1801BE